MYIKTDGIVLREVAYQDSDKLLTVLTREYGKLTVRARGVRSSRSRSELVATFMAVLELCRSNLIRLAGSASDCTVTCDGDVPEELT